MRLSTIGAVTLWALLAAVSPAAATIDLNGNFRVDVTAPLLPSGLTCSLDFVQVGTALSATGSCPLAGAVSLPTGTIDTTTGVFSLSGSSVMLCPTLSIAGTAAADSQTFGGTMSCTGGPIPITGTVLGNRCGNGFVDPGEQCDDGNLTNGDCCNAACHYDSPGTSCSPDTNPCTTDACNGAGTCTHTNNTAPCDDGSDCTTGDVCGGGSCHGAFVAGGTACDDSDPCTVGDQCDGAGSCVAGTGTLECGSCMTCVNGFGCSAVGLIPTTCKAPFVPQSATLRLTDRPVDTHDSASWTWARGAATDLFDFGDPRATTGYKLCIYDQEFGIGYDHAILAAEIPAGGTCDGRPCWRGTNSGYVYKNKSASPDGIRAVLLKAGANGKAKILVQGKGGGLQMPSLPIDLGASPLLVQVQAANGQCWQAQYVSALKNTPITFKAKGN